MGILGNICRDNGICLAEINGERGKFLKNLLTCC